MAATRNGGRKNDGNEEGRENKGGNEERREIMTGIRKGGRIICKGESVDAIYNIYFIIFIWHLKLKWR